MKIALEYHEIRDLFERNGLPYLGNEKLHAMIGKLADGKGDVDRSQGDGAGKERLEFINNLIWEVKEVRADGKPLTKAERWAARFTEDTTGLTAEWSVSFNTDYGLTGDEDCLFSAIDAAIASSKSGDAS